MRQGHAVSCERRTQVELKGGKAMPYNKLYKKCIWVGGTLRVLLEVATCRLGHNHGDFTTHRESTACYVGVVGGCVVVQKHELMFPEAVCERHA
jgi:DNA-binding sugar fermentation-stimulating protein